MRTMVSAGTPLRGVDRAARSSGDDLRERGEAISVEGDMPCNETAWREFVGQCRPYVYHVALSILRDLDDAEDVSQEVLLRVYRFLSRFEHRASFSTWLYRITYNACVSYLAKKRRDQWHLSSLETVELADPRQDLADRESWVALKAALDGLPPLYREPARLFYLGQCSYREIAQRTSLSESTVKIRLYRARAALREAMEVA